MDKKNLKIISGGQTGVDQGALHAAIKSGISWGGWAPKGWKTENGKISILLRENLKEHSSSNYLARTKKNVIDSDATLILANSLQLNGGTLKTKIFCQELNKDFLIVDVNSTNACNKIYKWLFEKINNKQFILNVAGPRESKVSGIQKKTYKLLQNVFAYMFDDIEK